MPIWTDYKNYIRETNSEIGNDINEAEEISKIIGAMIEQRHALNISQRALAEQCGIPHSSVARIKSGKTAPNLNTLLKLFNQLGLKLDVNQRIGV